MVLKFERKFRELSYKFCYTKKFESNTKGVSLKKYDYNQFFERGVI